MTGANGAVGRAILQLARSSGPARLEVIAIVRSERAAAELHPLVVPVAHVARVSYADTASLAAAFDGAAAIIHLAGVLVERPGSTYEEANVETTRRVTEAIGQSGAAKLVLVGAVGADPTSANRYWRTKGQAEALARASGVSHTVLRVPMLLGHGTEAGAALRRHARRPAALLVGGGRTLQQPLSVDDLARAAVIACSPTIAKDRIVELVGPISLPERELVACAARLLGRRIRIVPAPAPIVRLALVTLRSIGAPGASPDALEVLTTDTRIDPAPAAREFGIDLTGLDDMIRDSLEP